MADLFQGSALPSTITTEQKQTTAPDFYTNYLQDIANLGQNAVTQGGVAGLSPLQQQAFQMAPQAAFAGAGSMGAGSQLMGQAGMTTTPDVVQNYMNPYTSNVVDEMGRLQQKNIQQNVLPGLNAAGASTGNFGSSRMANATGQTMADMQANLTGQQYGALNTGYQNAMTSAGADLNRTLQSGQALGNLGTQQNQTSLAGLNELNTLGGVQQAQGQALLNQPMTEATNYSKLLQPYAASIPTGTTSQLIKPGEIGQYALSPLSQISGLASLLNSWNPNNTAANAANAANVSVAAKNSGLTISPDGTYYTGAGGNYTYDQNTGQFVPKGNNGGSIGYDMGGSITNGGSVSQNVFNDALNGNTMGYANGGHVYDQYGNAIG